MSDAARSNWIPRRRIRIAVGVAAGLGVAALAGMALSPVTLVLLVPALGAAWAARTMLSIRRHLSHDGGGIERRIHQLMVAELALPADCDHQLLDVGCGDASLLIALLQRSPTLRATGVDLWGAGWEYARDRCEQRVHDAGSHAQFAQMDAARLDFDDAAFDIVTSIMCFHEVRLTDAPRSEGPLAAVREALRVLRPGGVFIFIDRFDDRGEFGPPSALAAALSHATDLRHVPLGDLLQLPHPLTSSRALGPAALITGSIAAGR